MSVEEAEEVMKNLGGLAPIPEEKHNAHSFLYSVATSEDTTKVANLTTEEVGLAKLPVRTYKELALFCKEIANMDFMSDYFDKNKQEQKKLPIVIELSIFSFVLFESF